MCLTPVALKRTSAKLDGYHTDLVPCGRCPDCRKRRINGWAFRLMQEQRRADTSVFVTFTYENAPLSFNKIPTLEKSDLQKFFKRLRKNFHATSLKYYAAGEYGENYHRPHYHAIIFNIPQEALNQDTLAKHWKHGFVHVGTVTENSVYYTLKYLQKGKWEPEHELDDRNPEFQVMSKGLGKAYLTENNVTNLRAKNKPFITVEGGQRQTIPRYFKEKVWNDSERRLMAELNPIPLEVPIDEKTRVERVKHAFRQQNIKQCISDTNSQALTKAQVTAITQRNYTQLLTSITLSKSSWSDLLEETDPL